MLFGVFLGYIDVEKMKGGEAVQGRIQGGFEGFVRTPPGW